MGNSVREVLAGYVSRGEVAGAVSLVAHGDDVQVEPAGAARRDTLLRIASMTKPVIAAAAMILVERCLLRLDEPLDRLLPELAARRVLTRMDGPLTETVPAERSLTLRDLLTFRLGFGLVLLPPDTLPIQRATSQLQLGQHEPRPQLPPPPDEWLRRFATLPLMHQPGAAWLYNTGSDLLGVLLARAAGKPLDAVLRELIFEPLGMHDTAFWVPPEKLARFGPCFTADGKPYDAADGQWSKPPAFPSGAAGLVSTVDDVLAFSRMLLGSDGSRGPRVLSRTSRELMTMDHLTPAQKAASSFPGMFESLSWGFGMAVVTRRDDVHHVGTVGWDGGLGSAWRADPVADVATILLTTNAWSSPNPPLIVRDFWTAAYAALG